MCSLPEGRSSPFGSIWSSGRSFKHTKSHWSCRRSQLSHTASWSPVTASSIGARRQRRQKFWRSESLELGVWKCGRSTASDPDGHDCQSSHQGEYCCLLSPTYYQSISRELWPKYLKHCQVHYRQCVDTKMSDVSNVRIWLSEQKRLESSAEGRQRRCRHNFRWQTVPLLRVSNRKCSAANGGMVNRRLDEAVVAGRAKPSATWKVHNVGKRAKVRWCAAMEDLIHRDGITYHTVVQHVLWHTQMDIR